jgi:hypothetical protein
LKKESDIIHTICRDECGVVRASPCDDGGESVLGFRQIVAQVCFFVLVAQKRSKNDNEKK